MANKDYRITNLANGRETYLYDVPEDVVVLAADEHVAATGNSHYVQVLRELSSLGVNAVSAGSCEPCEAPPADEASETMVSLMDIIEQEIAKSVAKEATFNDRILEHLAAMGDWLDDMPEEEADAVRAAIEEGAVFNFMNSFSQPDGEDDGA